MIKKPLFYSLILPLTIIQEQLSQQYLRKNDLKCVGHRDEVVTSEIRGDVILLIYFF